MSHVCESPVEYELLAALERIQPRAAELGFAFSTQHEFAPFRLDFAFVAADGRKLAVEVDGHDFHDRTVDQATWDRKRDRYLALGNWRVVRFTGTEVHRGAFTCASEILAHLEHLSVSESRAKLATSIAQTMLRLVKKTEEKAAEKQRQFRLRYASLYGWKENPNNPSVVYRDFVACGEVRSEAVFISDIFQRIAKDIVDGKFTLKQMDGGGWPTEVSDYVKKLRANR